jgi:hypothetical protein
MKWAAIAAVCWGVGAIHASGPIAVYALVDKVTVEPNADHPRRIQLSGVFILSSVPDGCGSPSLPCSTTYSAAQKGYLYFSLPGQYADQALREWVDMKSVAGTRQVVGFGSGWFRNDARVRKDGEKAEGPQEWPINNTGVVKVNADRPEAKALLEYRDK